MLCSYLFRVYLKDPKNFREVHPFKIHSSTQTMLRLFYGLNCQITPPAFSQSQTLIHAFFLSYSLFFKLFYSYSITVVSIFPLPLPNTPAKLTSLPCFYPSPRFKQRFSIRFFFKCLNWFKGLLLFLVKPVFAQVPCYQLLCTNKVAPICVHTRVRVLNLHNRMSALAPAHLLSKAYGFLFYQQPKT